MNFSSFEDMAISLLDGGIAFSEGFLLT
jgi:hypothetical protein